MSPHAAEQDTVEVQVRRRPWREEIQRIDPEKLILLDESGVTIDMTRRYGRCPRGARVCEATLGEHWRTMTLLGAIRASGWVATMTVEAVTDGDVFLTYLGQLLYPSLQSGDVVARDNLSAHKMSGVRDRIEAADAGLLCLPPYSPDFNPIEQCWA